ncbi:MAG: response regulator [Deltaproteobacteria bacterium]|nr:response regulator [Deltaproteobacteria bacterium]
MTPDDTATPCRILVVEDNAVNRTVATRLLEKRGHVVIAVENGALAVDLTARERFDVVLMDIQMPVMDGLTATARIREREHGTGEHQPIVAVTAHALDEDRQRCIAAGMDDYLPKPIRSGDLFEKVARFAPSAPERAAAAPVVAAM